MPASHKMRKYQEQAIRQATPEELITKLLDIGIAACYRNDRRKVRAVLIELMSAINFEGGEIAQNLYHLYEFCLRECPLGDLELIREILDGVRDAWKEAFSKDNKAQAA